MRIGAIFPQTEIGGDVGAVRAYGTAVEALGYNHILAYDHVLGTDPAVHPGWSGPYDVDTTFHEPLVLFGFLAGITSLELVTGILIAPQRPTALIAKQAAEVDLLTGGRFRLGIGIGWNAVEYDSLGADFTSRGKRMSEQVELLRALWTRRTVMHEGKFDRVYGAGIAPLPIQQPIPLWLGGYADQALRRIGRLADGWFPGPRPGDGFEDAKAVVDHAAVAAGRDPASIGCEGRVAHRSGEIEATMEMLAGWRDAGATHVTVNTMRGGFATVDDHIAGLAEVATALGLSPTSATM